MTPETRKLWMGLAVGVVLGAASVGGALTMLRPIDPQRGQAAAPLAAQHDAGPQPAEGRQEAAHAVAQGDHGSAKPEVAASPPEPTNSLTLPPERLQSIGVRFEIARPQPLERTIRTVGRVEVDERRLAHVNVKLDGWIDQLYVSYTGERVRKGQVLFTLYSPELIATQSQYLLALQGRARLGSSDIPEVAAAARALLDVSRQRLRLWDIEESHIRDLERTGVILKTIPMHSPVGGTVINKTAVVGLNFKAGEELYTIADLSKVWVQADIFEYELPLIAIGQSATVALSHAPQLSFQAIARFIYPTVNPETRTAKVRFELDNSNEQLKPGMFSNLELKIPLGTRLVVPKDAVLETGQRQLVFIHHGGGRLEWRTVKPGLRADDWIEILSGVSEGDHIVTSANFLLDSESQLKAAMGAMKH